MIGNKKVPNYKRDACLAYILIAATNPLLYTSVAYLGYIYVWIDIARTVPSVGKISEVPRFIQLAKGDGS